MVDMKGPRGRRVLVVLVVMLAAACTWVWIRPSASVSARPAATASLAPAAVLRVDTSRPGNEFALGAVGLSTEAWELSSGRLSADHPSLVHLMRLLGPSVLRIGGSSVDFSWWTSSGEPPPPWATSTVTPSDLSVLHELLIATGWRVLLGVDFGHFEPARVADEARYAKEILGKSLLGIEIGNEPNDYSNKNRKVILRPPTYGVGQYLREAEAYRQALIAATPGVAVYGPALTEQKNSWLTQIGTAADVFTQLTQHYYPINICPTTPPPSPQPTAVELLSPTVRQEENEILQVLASAGAAAGRSTRIGETNSVACSGKDDADPAFAGALWSLDWALRASSAGVMGLNFHGHLGACGPYRESPICASDSEAAQAGDVIAQPEYYGLLAARQLEGGKFVPTRLIAPGPLPNLTAWAALAANGTVRIAIDNLATAGLPQPVSISTSGYTATAETLTAPSVGASSGITLGGVPVADEGLWHPRSKRLPRVHGSSRVVVQPTSAVILTLHPTLRG